MKSKAKEFGSQLVLVDIKDTFGANNGSGIIDKKRIVYFTYRKKK